MADIEVLKHSSGWAELILNRPERKNAITGPLGEQLAAALVELDADDAVQVILLRGAGGAFCSGLDLKAFNADPAPAWLPQFQTIWRGAHRALYNCRKPLVGALERYAINGGAALAFACDILLAEEDAFVQVGEVQLGMAAPYNLAWLSLRYSEHLVAPLVLIGERCPADRLQQLGLLHEVTANQQALERAQQLCEQLASYPSGALARIKGGLRWAKPTDADAWFDQFTQHAQGGAKPPPLAAD